MTSMLIVLPIVGALVVWAAPLPRDATASLAVLSRSPRSASGSRRSWASTSPPPCCRTRRSATWFGDLGVSYHVGFYGFSLWLAGLTVVVGRRDDRIRRLGRPRPGAGLLRPHALPRRRRRRRLRLPGPAPLLRLLRGDADPDLRPRRRLGRPEPDRRDDHLRHLHDGRLAADARVDRRLRALAGHVQPDRLRARAGTSGSSSASSIAFAVKAPLLPFHGWLRTAYTEAPPEVAAMLSGVVSKAAVFGLIWIVIPHFPGPVDELAHRRARARRGRPPLRLAARLPAARRARRRRVLVDGPDEPDRARHLRRGRPRRHRRRPALGQPRARLRRDVPARRDADPAHRHRPLLGARRDGEGPPGARDARAWSSACSPSPFPARSNFVGEFSILAGVFTQGWGYAAAGAAAIVLAAMYSLRLISAVLHREPRRGGAQGVARPPPRRARAARPARRDPARALRLAGRRSATTCSPPGPRSRRPRRRRHDRRRLDPDAARRLARALAVARAPRRLRDLPARRRPRPSREPSAPSPPSSPEPASSPRACSRASSSTARPRSSS